MKDYFVYMLLCADGSYYTGVTNDYERRFQEHQHGIHPESYTYHRRPVKLVYVGGFGDVWEAITWEKQIKGWSRKKKATLIRQEFEVLPRLAACQNIPSAFRNMTLRRARYCYRWKTHVILRHGSG